MKLHALLALVGLASGFAVFSGCANGDFTSTSGQQQNTPVKPHARDQGGSISPEWVDWTKDWRSQKSPQSSEEPYPYGIGQP
jgi:hypothetical protein